MVSNKVNQQIGKIFEPLVVETVEIIIQLVLAVEGMICICMNYSDLFYISVIS